MENLDKILKDLQNEGLCRVVNDKDGDPFIIVESWKDVRDISIILGHEPEDDYDSSALDELGCDWGFADSYTSCDMCDTLICTEPDYSGKGPDYWINYEGGYIVCGDCIRKDPADYLSHLTNNSDVANTILGRDQLRKLGYELISEEYANGWYDRTDSPSEILDKALEENPNGEFIFNISGGNPFETRFELWALEDTLEESAPERPIFTYKEKQ